MAAQTPVPGCVRHSGMGFLYVCLDCNEELICAKCIVDIHNGHKVTILDDVMSDKKVELQEYIDRMTDTTNRSLQGEVTLAEEKIKENGKSFRKMIADIKDQAQKMKLEIDKCADKLIQLCCDLEKSNEEMLKSYKSALETLKDENNRRIEDCQQTLKSGTIMEMIEKAKETKSTTGISPVSGKLQNVHFQPGPISVSKLYNSLGFVIVDGIIKATVVSEFTHKSHIITCRTTRDNNTWLLYWKDSNIYRLDQTGEVKETVQCTVKVQNMAISPTTGRVWFCCFHHRTIQEVLDDHTIVTRIVTDSPPGSLCITTNNTVVVGTAGKIVMYTTEGQKVESAGAKDPCTQKAVMPVNMAYCTQTGNVVVTDWDNVSADYYIAGKEPGKQPHIKLMDKHLNVKFSYPCKDTPDVGTRDRTRGDEQRSLFYPCDVSFDETGDILVADLVTKSIALIDGYRGDYIRAVYTDDFVIWSISSHKDGFLWVVMPDQKKVRILKYK